MDSQDQSQLSQAILRRDYATISRMLENFKSLPWLQTGLRSKKQSILMFAAQKGDLECVKRVLQAGALIGQKDQQEGNSCFYAIKNQNASRQILQLFFDKDAKLIHSLKKNKKTLLVAAVQNKNFRALSLLLEKGASPDDPLQDFAQTPLMIAVSMTRNKIISSVDQKIIHALISHGADPFRKNRKADPKNSFQINPDVGMRDFLNRCLKSQCVPKEGDLVSQGKFRSPRQADEFQVRKKREVRNERQRKKQDQRVAQLQMRIGKLQQQNDKLRAKIQRSCNIKRLFHSEQQLYSHLTFQIQLHCKRLQITNRNKAELFEQVIALFTSSLQAKFKVTVKVFGSYATGLSLPESDIDLVVGWMEETNQTHPLQLIEKVVRQMEQVFETNLINRRRTSMPVLKVRLNQKYGQQQVDITLDSELHNGLACVELVKIYISMFRQLKFLTLVLKSFIYRNGLHDTYQGGLSSYTLTMMLLSLLICLKNQQRPLGQLLLDFLYFFGMQFDSNSSGIFVPLPSQLSKGPEVIRPYFNIINPQSKVFQVFDPLNPSNNISKAAYRSQAIQEAFSAGYFALRSRFQCEKEECESRDELGCCSLNKFFVCALPELLRNESIK